MAERMGFEPTIPLTAYKLSKPGLISKNRIYFLPRNRSLQQKWRTQDREPDSGQKTPEFN